jgi:NAD(P)-dependent dehydrogenase (short-subunit alcohol dehydrogenase family)
MATDATFVNGRQWISEVRAQVDALDQAIIQAVEGTPTPALDRSLVRLSNAANRSRLWLVTAGVVAAAGGTRGRRAAGEAVAAIGMASAVSNLVLKPLRRRRRPEVPADGQVSPQVLVNNAGSASSASVADTSTDAWNETLRVNLSGVFHCTRAALPALAAMPFARIVNIASTAGLIGYPNVAAYCAAKHGVIGLTRALALEVARTGITVNAVSGVHRDVDRRRGDRKHR